jgi:anaerobic ribonucleoside-triphosphate reductase activating protein
VSDLTWIVDPTTGDLLVEGLSLEEAPGLAGDLLPPASEFGCARPLTILPPPTASPEEIAGSACVRTTGYYHDSLVEGPGRRSCVLLSGCELHCPKCWVPQLHPAEAGQLVPVNRLADALLHPAFTRDGVSLLGGEPFFQADSLWALVLALRERGCPHILCYSGYTYGALRRRARRQPTIDAILDDIDVLVDGPYVEARANGAGAWTGSGNQRVIDLRATRRTGCVILLEERLPCPSRARP